MTHSTSHPSDVPTQSPGSVGALDSRSTPGDPDDLESSIRQGAAWSLFNNAASRFASFAATIALARLLAPTDYGVFAVALVVLTALLSMNELGVSVAIVKWERGAERIAPTVTTLALTSSVVLYALCFVAAPWVATMLNAPEATAVIRVLSLGVIADGAASVSAAFITRSFQQRKRMAIDLVSFVIGAVLSVGLAVLGFGAWSIALGLLTTAITAAALNVWWAPVRLLPGFDREIAKEVLGFGLPLAGASLVLFALLNVDYVVVGSQIDAKQLGLYLLAFNLSSWPINLVAVAVRRVSLAGFARLAMDPQLAGRSFTRAIGVVLAIALPMCVLLATYSSSIIDVLYGSKWSSAATVVSWLCVLAAVRLVAELSYDFLVAMGRTRLNLIAQTVWFVLLVPALIVGARINGVVGVAVAHSVVAMLIAVPLLAYVLHATGVSRRPLLVSISRPIIGGLCIIVTSFGVKSLGLAPFATAVVGGAVGVAVYAAVLAPARQRYYVLVGE